LTGRVINRMLRAGQTPILHVEAGNERAIAMYHGLGFSPQGIPPALREADAVGTLVPDVVHFPRP
jgi:ribosomal protein S18 acetylase RimI-like enzyme